jgi:D-hexose-6-phosphate mutarotase
MRAARRIASQIAITVADLGTETYRQFVCVERGAAFDDRWLIPAGEYFSASMSITEQPGTLVGTY